MFAGMLCVFLSGCDWGPTDEVTALRVLHTEGYTDITLTGFVWNAGCGLDWNRTGFKARGPTGAPARGVVCSGLGSAEVRIR